MIRQKTRDWLKQSRISYAEIERETGIDADYISKFVRGVRSNPRCETIEKIWDYIKTKGFNFSLSDYEDEQRAA